VEVICERDPPLPLTRSERFKAWLERHRSRFAMAFALAYLAFFAACLLTPSAWIDDSAYAALPWWSLVHRALDVALAWMGARWLAQQMRMCP
jgi:ATP adenylyltransferase/5',5'''-P-1,P-4-tetraphosphate phosphorylase II